MTTAAAPARYTPVVYLDPKHPTRRDQEMWVVSHRVGGFVNVRRFDTETAARDYARSL